MASLYLPPLRPYQRSLLSDPARDVLCVSATQVGKTFGMASWLLARMWEYRGPHVWWWLAPTYNQVVQGVRLMQSISDSAGVSKSVTMTPYPVLKLINGATCEFRSWEREQNLAGTTIAGGVVDEAGLLSPQAQAMISTRRSATLGPLRYIGNPGIVAGPFRRLCSLGEQARTNPDLAGTYSFHTWTWEDKYRALEGQAAAEYRSFIDEERRSLPEFEFRRLYMAEWTEDEAAVFRNVGECIAGSDKLQPGSDSFVLGVDVAQSVDYLAAVSMGRDSRRLDLRYRVRGVGYPQAAQELKQIADSLNATMVVEDNGPGVALIQELHRLEANVIRFTTTNQSKQELILNLAADLQQKRIAIGDHSPMPYEFSIYRYERTPSGTYRYSAPAGEHDDTVMAAALARYGVGRAVNLQEYGWIG